MKVQAILLMGGTGERFGSSKPKQFHLLAGKKVYLHTLERFLECKLFQEVILVTPKAWILEVENDLKIYSSVVLRVVEGGATRQESSLRGILACSPDTDVVVIHDAVRPFVSERILQENVAKASEVGAVDTCIASADTLVYAPQGDFIEAVPVRAHYLRGQTPQSFRYEVILDAHRKAMDKPLAGVSDDCRLVREYGSSVAIVTGEEGNIKITTPLDILLAEQLLRKSLFFSHGSARRDLQGARIAITGGTGGIGRAVAALLEMRGAIPLLLSRSAPTYRVDFFNSSSIASYFKNLYEQEGPIDALVNCIGLLERLPLCEQTEESINAQIDLNLRGVILACKYAHLKQGGQIVNVASSSYSQGRGGMAVYAAAKAAVVNFTQGFAQERPDLIVNVIAPQRTDTSMRRSQFPNEDPSSLLTTEEVAEEIIGLLQRAQRFESVIEIRKK